MRKVFAILGASLVAMSALSAAPTVDKGCGSSQYCKCSPACQCGKKCSCESSCHCK